MALDALYINRTLISLIAVSIALFFCFEYLPTKHHQLFPFPPHAINAYSDTLNGGNSNILWDRKDKPETFQCTLKDGAPYPFCGVIFHFNFGDYIGNDYSLDMRSFEKLKVHIETSSSVNFLRLNIRSEVHPPFNVKDDNSTMFMSTMLSKEELNRQVEINMDRFKVGQWWLKLYNLGPEYATPNMSKVKSFAMDLTFENSRYIEHTVAINKVELVGKMISREHWYLSIGCLWVGFFLYRIFLSRINYRKSPRDPRAFTTSIEGGHKELDEKNTCAKKFSEVDPLTKIFNRQGFENNIQQRISQNKTKDQETWTTIFIDIDAFRKVNDEHGRDIGDKVLIEFAHLIRDQIREQDCFARWGPEEFILMCRNSERKRGYAIAEKIRESVEHHRFVEELSIGITASLGVSLFNKKSHSRLAIQKANEALYEAKSQGSNRVVLTNWGKNELRP